MSTDKPQMAATKIRRPTANLGGKGRSKTAGDSQDAATSEKREAPYPQILLSDLKSSI
jgi:hypothetical protein